MNITIRMPIKTESLNVMLGLHHFPRAKMARAQRGDAWKHMRQHGLPPADFAPITVTMTRCSAGILDRDNLVGSQKHIRDGIADWLGVPDNDPRVTWQYEQAMAPRKEYAVLVEVRES